MKSNGLLKVSSILLIIGGALAIIVGIIALIGIGALAVFASEMGGTGALTFAAVLSLLGAIFELVAGISGVKNAAKPEKAQNCIVFGIIVAVLCVAGNILYSVSYASLTETAFSPNFVGLVTGLVLPVLYLIGAFQSKKSIHA
ncbi:hypothetical protein LQZ18_09935 [Lachnospiraceae bacterium ZAX-1]